MSTSRILWALVTLVVTGAIIWWVLQPTAVTFTVRGVSPGYDPSNSIPNSGAFGRVTALARVNKSTYLAGTEWGGLLKTTDNGQNWQHIDSLLSVAIWAIATDGDRVFVAAGEDGLILGTGTTSSISISEDGGSTWQHPQIRDWDTCELSNTKSAFGVSLATAPNSRSGRATFFATGCGLVSNLSGTWQLLAQGRNQKFSDITVANDRLVACTSDTVYSFDIDFASRQLRPKGTGFIDGKCLLDSTDAAGQITFAMSVDKVVFRSEDGVKWTQLNPPPTVNIRGARGGLAVGPKGEIWFGRSEVYQIVCSASHCSWVATGLGTARLHADFGAVVYDTAGCPAIIGTDGGPYYAVGASSTSCPKGWAPAQGKGQALWVTSLVALSGSTPDEDIVAIGTQDNGMLLSQDAGGNWVSRYGSDVYDVVARNPSEILYTINTIDKLGRDGAPPTVIAVPILAPTLQPMQSMDLISYWKDDEYVFATERGIATLSGISGTPKWNSLCKNCSWTPCALRTTGTAIYAASNCKGPWEQQMGATIYRFVSGAWTKVIDSSGTFDVVPGSPSSILALGQWGTAKDPGVYRITPKSGGGWTTSRIGALDKLITHGGLIAASVSGGPVGLLESGELGYAQPSLIAVDPQDAKVILVGTHDAGLFLSVDAGSHWQAVVDLNNPERITRPLVAAFTRSGNQRTIYVGSQGRGVWRVQFIA